jgi:hypothetical protein
MDHADPIDVLNRLLAIHCRALPQYLTDASPWTREGDERATAVLQQMVADQRAIAGRIAELIQQRGGRLESSVFPMQFTDLNLVSLDYLLRILPQYQQRDITAIAQCVQELGMDFEAHNLAEEALGMAKAHHEMLQELAAPPVGTA